MPQHVDQCFERRFGLVIEKQARDLAEESVMSGFVNRDQPARRRQGRVGRRCSLDAFPSTASPRLR